MGTGPVLLMLCMAAGAEDAPPVAARPVRKPKMSWTLQFGLAHSADDADHYAVSGFQGRFPLFAFDRKDKSDQFGGLGLEIGAYPYPVTSRAYVPGPDADPNTAGKYNFWEAVGVSYYSPRIGPLQLEAGARLAFIDTAERVLTSPNGCGVSNRTEAHCNAYIKESLKTLDTILFPGFGGDRGTVRFVAAALTVKGIGGRVEWAQLNGGGSRVSARGVRWGLTVR
jgi:hypothetical protein